MPELMLKYVLLYRSENFANSVGFGNIGHGLQFLYLVLFLLSTLVLSYIETYQIGSEWTTVELLTAFAAFGNFLVGIWVLLPAYLFLRTLTLSVNTCHIIHENFVPDAIAQFILPASIIGYSVPIIMLFKFKLHTKFYQLFIESWFLTAVFVATLIGNNAATRSTCPTSRRRVYILPYILHLKHTYALIYVIMAIIHIATVGYVLSGDSSINFTRFLVPAHSIPELNPDSIKAAMFTCRKWGHLFAAAAVAIHGAFTVCELRVGGWINTNAMLRALGVWIRGLAGFGPSEALIGRGAGIVGFESVAIEGNNNLATLRLRNSEVVQMI
jgi:hypothetical protein